MSINYFRVIRNRMPHFFVNVDVVEYGPHFKSKRIKDLYNNSRYVVIDPKSSEIPVVGPFNVSVSINNFNFIENYLEEFDKIYSLSSKFVMFSCLSAGHPNIGQLHNLVHADFHCYRDLYGMFDSHKFHIDHNDSTLYFWGVKSSEV